MEPHPSNDGGARLKESQQDLVETFSDGVGF